jgi:hypothetical protein
MFITFPGGHTFLLRSASLAHFSSNKIQYSAVFVNAEPVKIDFFIPGYIMDIEYKTGGV